MLGKNCCKGFERLNMDWISAFNQASMNMQTANALRNNIEWNKLHHEQAQIEAIQKALQNEDPNTMNDYGYYVYEQGQHELGYQWMTKAALKGEATALANVTWYKLIEGDHEDATTLYDACRKKLKLNVNDYALANIDSNNILNNFGLGKKIPDAEKTWLINGAKTNHLESKFYPAVLAYEEKDFPKMDKILKTLKKAELDQMLNESIENQMVAKGWFKKWSSHAVKILNKFIDSN